MASEQFVVFQLAKEEYALPIAKVKEIIRYSGATRIPGSPAYMEGIINLRGKVLPVVDLATRFAMTADSAASRQALIVEAAEQDVGLVVDNVTEVLRLDDSAIEAANGFGRTNAFIRAIGKLEDRLLIILDMDEMFTQAEMQVMQTSC